MKLRKNMIVWLKIIFATLPVFTAIGAKPSVVCK